MRDVFVTVRLGPTATCRFDLELMQLQIHTDEGEFVGVIIELADLDPLLERMKRAVLEALPTRVRLKLIPTEDGE